MIQASHNLIVARRTAAGNWRFVPGYAEDDVHREYDLGIVELAQGRVDGTMCLFRIPRQTRAVRAKYFGQRLTMADEVKDHAGFHRVRRERRGD